MVDDGDPTCPACGEAVGARASYCMHCGADFESPVDGSAARSTGGANVGRDRDDPTDSDDFRTGIREAVHSLGDGASDSGAVSSDSGSAFGTESDSAVESDTGSAVEYDSGPAVDYESPSVGDASDAEADGRGWLHPDSLLDDSLTVVVGIVAGLVVGFVALISFGLLFEEAGVLAALVAWLGGTAYFARRRTVFDAIEFGAYAFAAVLLVAPLGLAVTADADLGGRAVLFVFALVPLGVIAAIVAGVGFFAGQWGVE